MRPACHDNRADITKAEVIMTMLCATKVTCLGLSLIAAGAMLPPLSTPAMAQAAGMAGLGEQDTIAVRATVTAIDQASRMITLTGPAGNSVTMQVGEQVRNFGQIKAGDKVVVRYHGSVAYVL